MNGWANRETWLINLWMGDALAEFRIEMGQAVTGADAREYVTDMLEDLYPEAVAASLVGDIVGGALATVNWREIAEHVNADHDEADHEAA